jgi:hypothetical protein
MISHNREVFYKYVTSATGKAILQTQTIRWGCPLTFNDPFDTQTEIHANFLSEEEFLSQFIDMAFELVYGEEEPVFVHEGTLGFANMIRILRKIRNRIPEEKFKIDIKEALDEGIPNAMSVLNSINYEWSEYINKYRVLCVTEEYDNLLMWAHYAKEHSGLVIELKCLPEYDTALCVAKPMAYVKEIPALADKEDYIKENMGLTTLDKTKYFNDLAFTKSSHWEYEKEWRCFSLTDEDITSKTNSFDTNSLLAKEINAVYLGCKISESEKKEILKILEANHYQHVKIFEAIPNKTKYQLDFNQIR